MCHAPDRLTAGFRNEPKGVVLDRQDDLNETVAVSLFAGLTNAMPNNITETMTSAGFVAKWASFPR